MSEELLGLVARRFEAFSAPFLDEPGDSFAFALKIKHTRNVAALASDISTRTDGPKNVLLAARIAAILHDVGRFPQYSRYRTFQDSISDNHARLSVRHALRERMLAGVPRDVRRLALAAVFLHNVRVLPHTPSQDILLTARIVRDSDKLDIFPVLIKHFSQESNEHPEVSLHARPHPTAYSPKVLELLMRRELSDYGQIYWANDFKLNAIGWLYDLNFRRSCEILSERGYLDTLFASLPADEPMRAFEAQIRGDLALRLNGGYTLP